MDTMLRTQQNVTDTFSKTLHAVTDMFSLLYLNYLMVML